MSSLLPFLMFSFNDEPSFGILSTHEQIFDIPQVIISVSAFPVNNEQNFDFCHVMMTAHFVYPME